MNTLFTPPRERPILFSVPMIRALLNGSKTQTRRIAKLPHQNPLGVWEPFNWGGEKGGRDKHGDPAPAQQTIAHTRTGEIIACPYGQPGDQLWVRETFQYRGASYDGRGIEDAEWFRCYGQGGAPDNWDPDFPNSWEPSVHMNLRRLTDPGEQEGEGITGWVTKRVPGIHMPRWASRITLEVTDVRVERLQDISEADATAEGTPHSLGHASGRTAVENYAHLWECINGDDSWKSNPWVWVVIFKRIEAAHDIKETK